MSDRDARRRALMDATNAILPPDVEILPDGADMVLDALDRHDAGQRTERT